MLLALLLAGCDTDGDGWAWPDDCDDASSLIHPGATEYCGGGDEDCDGKVDDGAVGLFYQDLDGDGQGNPSQPYTADQCEPPQGLVNDARDCDDGDASVLDGALELCNGVDDDCNGLTDDDDPGIDPGSLTPYFIDVDRDGYAGETSIARCSPLAGEALFPTDCDDADPRTFPGAPEVCLDGQVNDCDNLDADVCGFSSPRTKGTADMHFSGLTGAYFAGAFAVVDLDGDGILDLIAGEEAGRGGNGVLWWQLDAYRSTSSTRVTLPGPSGAGLGGAVRVVRDLDGDGVDEIVIGATGAGSDAGAVFGLSGVPGTDFPESASFAAFGPEASHLGWNVLGPGDTDGDGLAELYIVGHEEDGTGALWIAEGVPEAQLGEPTVVAETSDRYGQGLASLGDIDGDGLDDVAIGEPQRSVLWLVSAGSPEPVVGFTLSGAACGMAMAAIGDVDGDGLDDAAVSCPGLHDPVQLPLVGWTGAKLELISTLRLSVGESRAEQSLLPLGDIDGDGGIDLAVGLPDATVNVNNEGAVVVVMSPLDSGEIPSAQFTGGVTSAHLGRAIAAGDVDSDGNPDLLIEAGLSRGMFTATSSLNLFTYLAP